MEKRHTHGWLIAALLREMSGLEGKAMFEYVESSFAFNRCFRQGSVEVPSLWQKMATQLLANVEETWTRKRMGILLDLEGLKKHQICSFMWTDNFWIMPHSKRNLEQMLKDLNQEAERWDLAPKPASLWWTSTYSEDKIDMSIDTKTGRHRFLFEEHFKILGCTMNRQRKTHECQEERMQCANKAWRKEVKIYRSKDVPCRVKCRRMVEHVFCAFCFGSENWSWSHATLDRTKRWATKSISRPFRFRIEEDKTWSDYYTRTCIIARKYR